MQPVAPETGSPGTNRRRIVIYIGIAILVGLGTNLVMGLFMDRDKIWAAITQVSIWIIVLPFLAYVSQSFVDAIRLYIVARRCRHPVPLYDCFMNSMVGAFFAHVTPLAMGGQPFQIYHLSRHGMPNRIATNIILSRFVANAMTLVLILLAGIPVIIGITGNIPGMVVIFSIGLVVTILFALFFLILLIQPRIISWLTSFIARTRLGRFLGRVSKHPEWQAEFEHFTTELRSEVRFLWSKGLTTMIADFGLNLINLGLQTFAIWFPLYHLVSTDLSFLSVLVLYMAVWQVVFYIPSPGASGGLESMFTLIFSSMSGRAEMTLVAVVIWRFSTYYLSLLPGIFFSGIAFRRKAPAQT